VNRDQAHTLIRETFTQSFDKARFGNFSINLLNHMDESKTSAWKGPYIKDAFKDHVNYYERLGTFTSTDNEKLDVLIVHLATESKLEHARTALRNFVAHHLKTRDEKDAALVAFVSPTEKQWRFSYVKMEYATVEKESGKVGVETRLTPARRFSYIVGEGESCHTAQTRFLNLLQNTQTDPKLADIEEAFSVETVTKEFFKQYANLFGHIHKALEKIVEKDRTIREEFHTKNVSAVDFAKKLMGQIVFLYFLQKKGWLGVAKGHDWGSGPHDFLRRLANGEYGKFANFFNDILEPLFYDTLATDRGHEAWCNRFKCRIPFLNGGLFEPLGGYDWKKIDIILPNRLFNNTEYVEEGITGTGVLDVFDRYNFTVNEAEPLEKEVAIDPEMLGKVFENLIEENRRKGLGAYYTPREIVHYMCQESLINYLDTAINTAEESVVPIKPKQNKLFGESEPEQMALRATVHRKLVPREDIETFVHLGDQAAFYEAARISGTKSYKLHLPKSIEKHARLIDEKLTDITVCDPAAGSGAFLVGMMTEIVRARSSLTPYFNDVHERTPYHFKRHAIQNCLYGVDIDLGAVEIAKLRLWLSLVVDEEDAKQIKPLPNLDYKVVQGNSLLGLPFKSQRMARIEEIKQQFFDETDHEKKAKLKSKIDHELREAFAASKGSLGYEVDFDFEIYFSEVFHRKGGFDITIGNPPYVRADEQSDRHQRLRKAILASGSYETLWEKWDLFVAFIEKSYKVLKSFGVTSLIVSDAFCHSKYAQKPQEWFLKNARILRLDFCSDLKIFEAAVHNIVYFFQKADGTHNTPERRVHKQIFGNVCTLPSDEQAKLTHRAFFPGNEGYKGLFSKSLELGAICYVSVGMVVNAHEKLAPGAFTMDDLVQDIGDEMHPKAFVEGKHLDKWLPIRNLWLEWGTKRAPALFRRPTFPEIYEVPEKILVQRSPGPDPKCCFDDNHLHFTESSVSFVPWDMLAGVRNNSLKKSARYHDEPPPRPGLPKREELEATSRRFAVKYLLGVMNSMVAREFLRANRRSNIHLYPDDWKKLPIPDINPGKQEKVIALVDRILAAKKQDRNGNVAALEREIDRLVYELYGLTEEEIKVVEESTQR
jgi:type I restriction-modification system DNA methylase subunit